MLDVYFDIDSGAWREWQLLVSHQLLAGANNLSQRDDASMAAGSNYCVRRKADHN